MYHQAVYREWQEFTKQVCQSIWQALPSLLGGVSNIQPEKWARIANQGIIIPDHICVPDAKRHTSAG